MGRLILGVVAGYLAMAVVIFVVVWGAYLALGADRAFQAGSYSTSGLWIAISLVLSLVAALVGGGVCAVLARDARGPKALAVFVLLLGLAFAVPVLTARDAGSEPRPAGEPALTAMQKAHQPKWVAVATPFLGAAGVLAGGRRRRV
jgi:hypothetical protein